VPKITPLSRELYEYMVAHRTPDDALLEELREETLEATGPWSGMQVAADQGVLLGLLVGALGARNVIEVGTFTGYSALSMARALPAGGRLLACDVSEEYTAIARRFWEKAGVADRIELRLGPAADTLRALPEDPVWDFAFLDADKPSYPIYYEEILKRLRPSGVIAVDNVLWGGRVIDPAADDEQTRAIREFNDTVAADRRVQSVMLHVSDGLTLARKL
jgi:caffeoyl-CoA O-methyltransferase